MANVIINDTNLTNIANAIREKNGLTDTYKPSEMAGAILAITTGGSSGGDVEWPTSIYGYLQYFNYCGQIDSLLALVPELTLRHNLYSVSSNQHQLTNMMNGSSLEDMSNLIIIIPSGIQQMSQTFYDCNNLKALPEIRITGRTLSGITEFFYNCWNLREIDKDIFKYKNEDGTLYDGTTMAWNITSKGVWRNVFANCYSLRELPELPSEVTINSSNSSNGFNSMCKNCYALKEIVNFPIPYGSASGDMYYQTFYNCYAARRFTFATQEDGTPYVSTFSGATVDLSNNFGHSNTYNNNFTDNNSGITEDMIVSTGLGKVSDPHNARTNYPDTWVASGHLVSPYGHDAMVETINSLPDTSATGTNTIKFKVNQGEYIEGGSNALTEAEIAVATAKGWTVSLV